MRARSGWRLVALWAALILIVAAACSDLPDAVENAPDGGPPVDTSALGAARRLAAADGAAHALLAAAPEHGFRVEHEAWVTPTFAPAVQGPSWSVGAALGRHADRPLTVRLGGSERYGLTLTPVGAAPVPGVVEDGRVVFPGAYASTDLLVAADDARVAWMYLLHDAAAPTALALELGLGAGFASAALDPAGDVILSDDAGQALLRVSHPVLLDANGLRRDGSFELRGTTLWLALDTAGLAFPVLVDPAIETVVWEQRRNVPRGRSGHGLALDDNVQEIVLFGGMAGTFLGDTWVLRNSGWVLRSTSGPTARYNPAMGWNPDIGRVVLFGGGDATGARDDTWEWDGTQWTQGCGGTGCATRPAPRYSAAMAYQPGMPTPGYLMMFGGTDGGVFYNDIWNYTGTSWVNLTTGGTKPSPRSDTPMAYDVAHNYLLLHGGFDDNSPLNDTWSWSYGAWTDRTPGVNQGPVSYGHGMAYEDLDLNRMYLYGGWGPGGAEARMWEWTGTGWFDFGIADPGPLADTNMVASWGGYSLFLFGGITADGTRSGNSWNFTGLGLWGEVAEPAPRYGAPLAYDSVRERTVMFGGSDTQPLNGTWEWAGFNWKAICGTALTANCPIAARTGGGLSFHTSRSRVVAFGGNNGASDLNDTYEYNGTWTAMCGACVTGTSRPPVRQRHAQAYDAARDRTVVFGGLSGASTRLSDQWAWNGTQWAAQCGACTAGTTKPTARDRAAMTFDASRNVTVLFGGNSGLALLNDVWEWDGTNWFQRCTTAPCSTAAKPPVRQGATLTYDSTRQRVVLYGGNGPSGGYSDTWEWSGSAWTQTTTGSESGAPLARMAHGASYDAARRRLVMSGGVFQTFHQLGDTWEMHTRGAACSLAGFCNTGYCVDGVCCESGQCGTCQACNTTASPGVCAPVTLTTDPDTCTGTSSCDATGQCKLNIGQACATASQCGSGFCSDGYCCDAACSGGCDRCSQALGATANGTCTLVPLGGAGSCTGFLCDGAAGACPTTCDADGDCAATYYCSSDGTCRPRAAAGAACDTAAGQDCFTSGCRVCSGTTTCVDRVCCTTACSGTCQSCTGSGGTCVTLSSGYDDTCSSPNACGAGGVCRKDLGQACAAGTECASGFCADGVCCSGACAGGCDACTLALGASADGICTVLNAGAAGSGCGNYLCAGAASCPGTCSGDSACVQAAYCTSGAPRTCAADQANGAACTSGSQCTSGNCVDGVCCNTACGGTCQACTAAAKGTGADGTCGNVVAGADPDSDCATDPASTCDQDGACNGSGACRLYTAGTSCGAGTCSAGLATAFTCNGSGTCNGANTACSPFACGATACLTTCGNDAQCASGFYCAGGACLARVAQGGACTAANQCQSGFCADGVCCDVACGGSCQACTAAKKGSGANGVCGTVAAGSDPDNECPTDPSGSCKNDGSCDGAGACRQYSAGTSCATSVCAAATLTTSACNGTGTCVATGAPCTTGYGCASGTSCATSCTTDASCAGGYYCRTSDSTCQLRVANGSACTVAAACQSGFCVDGVCCDSACAGTCQACTAAKKGSGSNGSCGPVAAAADPDNECATQAASTCGSTGTCDGSGACQLWAFGTTCGTTSCVAALQTGQVCNGSGACVAGSSAPCPAGYVCASSTACATTCTSDSQCAASHYCRSSDSTCQPDAASGAACTSGSQCQSGFCVDGVCCDSACGGLCQACSAAKKGGGASGVCGNVAVDTDPDAECTADLPSSCGQTGSCSGTGACQRYAPGAPCGTSICSTGVQTGFQCDGFGTCQAGQTVQCSPYVCADGSTCRSTCTGDGDCVGTAWCDTAAGVCRGDLAKGGACARAAQCQTGFCADGVCCDQACDGTCQACAAALKGVGADGDCGPTASGTDPKSQCSTDAASTCQRTGTCDGAGDCALYALGTPCGATTCAAGQQSGLACNGLGTCVSAGAVACAPYTCEGAACATACVDDTDCIATHHCRVSDTTCQPDLGNGTACAAATQCQSGNCVDGVCCESPCTGTCQACSASRTGQSDGACRSVLAATDPDDECPDDGATSCRRSGACSGLGTCSLYAQGVACGATTCAAGSQTGFACDGLGTCTAGQTSPCSPYTCAGGTACRTDCAGDADCVPGAHCAGSTCVNDLPVGSACSAASWCSSGFCVDGVCCDQACTGTCRACTAARKGSGADGTCDLVVVGSDPDDECAVEAPATCGTDGSCDGAGGCRRWAPGTSCGANSCAGATLTGSQCDGFGACVPGQSSSCEPYLCLGGTTCGTSCGADSDCVGRAYCSGSVCVDRLPNGSSCASASACQSGFCVEGVCCDSACNGTCQACTAASKGSGADGVCGNARAGIDPQSQCADQGTSSCGRDGECDGAGACRNYPVGTVCGATTCVDGAVQGLVCAGPQLCQSGAQVSCAGYACAAGVCLTACASDGECASTHFCDVAGGTCEPKASDGTVCTAAAECRSGECVDGVCCNSACTGQCEACDVPSAPGRCTPVVGEPRGSRPACAGAPGTTPDELCQARLCDGSLSTTECLGYVGPEVACRDRGCADGVATFSATCNGAGACGVGGAATSRPCDPYVCDAEICKDFCLADADCAVGFRCDPSGECVGATTCDGDHSITDSRGETTDCAPFRCTSEGTCLDRCDTSADCVSGTVCNPDRVCVAPTRPAVAEEGGCGCRAAGSAPAGRSLASLAALLAFSWLIRRGSARRGRADSACALQGATASRAPRRGTAPRYLAALSTLVLVVLTAGAGCSSSDAEEAAAGPTPEAGTPPASTPPGHALALAERVAAPHAQLAARLAPQDSGGFVLEGREAVSPAWQAARIEPSLRVGARVPSVADGLFAFGVGRSEAFQLLLHPVDAAPAALAVDRGRASYADVHPATDLLLSADEDRAEWMLLLRDASAPRRFRYDVTVGAGLPGSRFDPAGNLLLLDAQGEALLRVTRPVAFDAAGATRELGLGWTGTELVIEADLDGLAFPVLIDPSVEVVVWEQKLGPPRARRYAAMGYDATRRKTVLFGGGNPTAFGDTWTWDGTVWQLRSTTGPSARYGASMAWDSARSRMVLFGGLNTSGVAQSDTWEWDGTSWTQVCLSGCSGPTARWGQGMTFDSARNVTVLFGGFVGLAASNQVWEWNGTTWTSRGTIATARGNAFVTYDPVRAYTLIAGGWDGTTTLTDTWTWNGTSAAALGSALGFVGRYSGAGVWSSASSRVLAIGGNSGAAPVSNVQAWTGAAWVNQAALSTGARQMLVAADDSVRGRVVAFGGTNGAATYLATTLEWTFDSWTDPAGLLPPRVGTSAGYNSTRARSVLYGGSTGGTAVGQTWEWNGFAWTQTCTACSSPSARTEHTISTDAITWLFGGRSGGVYNNELWTYDGTAWGQLCAACATKPSARSRAAAAYWPQGNQFHVFGGQGPAVVGTHYSYSAGAWTQRCGACVAGTSIPAARAGASMAASTNATSAPLLIFGGANGATYYNDLWSWTGTAWAQLCSTAPCNATRPVARSDASFVYDSTRNEFILWGGVNASGALNDTWTWNGATWKQTTTGAEPGAPPVRSLHASAFDSGRRRMMTFGGQASTGELGDTWELHIRSGDCVSADDCQTGFCVDGVCCETAQCPTCQACNLPTSPGLCAFVPFGADLDSCASSNTCDGVGNCLLADGQACTTNAQCARGFCQNGVCCSTACAGGCDVCSVAAGSTANGLCAIRPDGATGAGCGAMLCNGVLADCPATCAADVDCATTHFCASDGTCQVRRSAGQACNLGSGGDCRVVGCRECTGVLGCVDGVCCTSTCAGTCQTCNGTAPGTCTTVTSGIDGSTCVAPNTCTSTGACKKQDGQACAAGTECASGSCADGVCCNLACAGGCDVCRTALGASADGVCTVLSSGAVGTGCAPYLCSGQGACPTVCASDAGCAAGYYCRPSDSTCQVKLSNGAACGTASACTSGFCVDGVCCATQCTGACQACSVGKTGAASGTCRPVSAGTDPDAECPTDAASGCQRDGTCDGSGACRLYLSGTSCGAASCTSGTATSLACNGSGTCTPTNTSCAPYTCGATACNSSCVTDAECAPGQYCSASACVAKRAQGQLCVSANECQSGSCVDGFCCDTACGGACQACSTARKGSGANGVCGNIAGGTDPDGECPDDGAASCQRDGFCSGTGSCRRYGAGVTCAATSCNAAVTTQRTCDGAGTCGSSATPCAAGYACASATACAVSCTSNSDCASTHFCQTSDGTCRSKLGTGTACASASQCQSGNCVDGFCCDTACAGTCQACSAARKGSGVDGTCGAIRDDTDPDAECAAASPTTCGLTGTCNGLGACKQWPSGTACGTTTCAAGVQTGQICNGTGACVSGASAPCATGYVCASASACAATCGTDAQCAAAYFCRVTDGTCQADLAQGAACGSDSQCQSGRCVDGVCCDSPCTGLCQACSAARKGTGADGVCGAVAAATDPDDECAAGSPSSCGLDGFCDGAGACGRYAPGTVCGTTTCTSGTQTGYACDGFGGCQAGQTVSCAPYVCAGSSACRSTCTQDSDCTPQSYCEVATGECKPDRGLGGICASAAECSSGFCVDGVCCSTACTGTCQACSAALKGTGTDGTCGNVAADTDPKQSCAVEAPSTCGRTGLCNASGGCALYALGAVCGATTCTSGTQTGYTCNGLGTCNPSGATACAPYQCAGSVCGTSCVADSDCAGTHYCQASTGTCQPDQAAGASCAGAGQCQSGNCVDGVCCESPCAGLCQACSLSRTGQADGLCRSVSSGSDPDDECADAGAASCGNSGVCSGLGTCALYSSGTVCGASTCAGGVQNGFSCDGLGACRAGQATDCAPYVCNGSTACRTTCSADVDCVGTSYCEVTTGQCRPDQVNGATCDAASQCLSGNCVDGVCCDQACSGSCRACSASRKGGGADGVCDVVSGGTDPDNDCAVEAPGTCGRDGECDGAGGCRRWALGTGCGQNSCSGSQLTGSQCDGFGACVAGQTRPCDPYVCLGGNACATSCGSDADCVATAWCAAGECVPRLALGEACTAGNQCQSTFCVEGVCCDQACTGTCQACGAAAKLDGLADGRCGLARDGADPHGDCEDEGQTTCGRDGTCDGAGACRLYAAGSLCGETSCVGNVQTGFACTGAGVCQAGSQVDCQRFACAVGRCLDTCGSDGDCSATAYCDLTTGDCVPRLADGAVCTEASACASGYCVDGVCCDTACSGQCEACDLATALGACSPVVGAPHGDRPACPGATGTELDGLCEARVCDGTRSTTSCVGYVGSETPCRDAACADGTETFSATCDGAGRCNTEGAVQARRCAPFACGPAACLDTCSADADCSTGNRCDTGSGQCVSGATCDGDHTVTQQDGATIDCAPFRCDVSGACIARCTTSSECVSPAVCNGDRLCVVPTRAAVAEDSGCGCRAPGGTAPRPAGLLGLLALAGALGVRRRGFGLRASAATSPPRA